MDIQYLNDVPLPEGWPSDEMLDPLHPGHGPLPQMQGLLEAEGEKYTVAVWDTGEAILTFLELVKEEDPDLEAPMLPLEEVHRSRGWIAQTYRWTEDESAMVCNSQRVYIPDYPGLKEENVWMREIYRQVMEGCVRLALTMAPGLPIQTIQRLARLRSR